MKRPRRPWYARETSRPLPDIEEIQRLRAAVESWAAESGRDFPWRHTRDTWTVAATEVLLQQTSADAVSRHWPDFFRRFPRPSTITASPVETLRSALEPLGLANQRAARLHALASWMTEHGDLPPERDALEAIPAVGQYVASAVLAVCYGQPEPLLDVNMARVLERYFGQRELADLRDDPWLQEIARAAFPGARLGWAVLDFAALICRARHPKCGLCPVRDTCKGHSVWSRSALTSGRLSNSRTPGTTGPST